MTNEEKKLLTDIIIGISSIDDHLEGRRVLEEYIKNKTKRRAVERELEIIGEAVNKLLKLTRLSKFHMPDRSLILGTKLFTHTTM